MPKTAEAKAHSNFERLVASFRRVLQAVIAGMIVLPLMKLEGCSTVQAAMAMSARG
jgi:hypothetical protein